MSTPSSTVRLETPVSPELHNMLKRAAEIQGRTMTDFVISAMQDAAQQTIEQTQIMRLSIEDQHIFANALLSPPPQTPALTRAFANRKKLLHTE